jgi:hypothetical protein
MGIQPVFRTCGCMFWDQRPTDPENSAPRARACGAVATGRAKTLSGYKNPFSARASYDALHLKGGRGYAIEPEIRKKASLLRTHARACAPRYTFQ